MWKNSIVSLLILSSGILANAQVQNSFNVSDHSQFDKIKFSLHATEGRCYIEPGEAPDHVNVESLSEETTGHEYDEKIIDRTKHVNLRFRDENKSLTSSISRRMFSRQSTDNYTWKVYLSKVKPMDLDLTYAVGDTYIDLSGLPVENLKMHTGSANVHVNYENDMGNQLEMDTFLIKVDLGSFKARNLHLSRSRNVIADVGFGTMHMDFRHAENIGTNVIATVGAGKLEVILPSGEIPVRININDSPLCHIKVPKEFTLVSENEFVNQNIRVGESDYLTFNVDVAVGNIVFRSSK